MLAQEAGPELVGKLLALHRTVPGTDSPPEEPSLGIVCWGLVCCSFGGAGAPSACKLMSPAGARQVKGKCTLFLYFIGWLLCLEIGMRVSVGQVSSQRICDDQPCKPAF